MCFFPLEATTDCKCARDTMDNTRGVRDITKSWNTSVNLTKPTVQLFRKQVQTTHAQHLIAKVKKHQLWREAPGEEGNQKKEKTTKANTCLRSEANNDEKNKNTTDEAEDIKTNFGH